jgi:ribosome-associated translation inhibitor RaiA
MKLSVSFKDVERHNPIEKEVERAVAKLNTLLKSYEPDLVQLHAVFSKVPRTEEHALALNLTLPTGTLHATASNEHLRAVCKKAFSEINAQVKKHQARLRKDYEWKRKRPRARPRTAEAFS